MASNLSRIDLHVHSCFSNNGDDSLLKLLGARECYTTPKQVYQRAKKRGMDFVTLTDHDTIEGALTLAHLDDFIIGEEVTVGFPEDQVKIHVICIDITESQHRILHEIRRNVYELVTYLYQENILHHVAHPFFGMPEIGLEHVEKLLLLFKRFEVRNGGKELYPGNLLETMLADLTPGDLWRLADKHDLAPVGDEPWIKFIAGGSDDHGGNMIGYPHTVTPGASSRRELLDYIRDGETRVEESGGSPLSVAWAISSVAWQDFSRRKFRHDVLKKKLALHVAGHFFSHPKSWMARQEARLLLKGVDRYSRGKDNNLTKLLGNQTVRDFFVHGIDPNAENNETVYQLVKDHVHNRIKQLVTENNDANLLRVLPQILLPAVPYWIGFHTEYRDKPLMRLVRKQFLPDQRSQIAVFTDVSSSEAESSQMIGNFLESESIEKEECILFGLSLAPSQMPSAMDFEPLGQIHPFRQSEVGFQIPPVMDVIRSFSRGDYRLIYLHTFGLMGLLGLAIGKLLKVPVICQYPYAEIRALQINSVTVSQQKTVVRAFRTLLKWADKIRVDSEVQYKHAVALGVIPGRADIERNLINSDFSWVNPFSLLRQTAVNSILDLMD